MVSRRFAKFIFVGGIGFLVDAGVLVELLEAVGHGRRCAVQRAVRPFVQDLPLLGRGGVRLDVFRTEQGVRLAPEHPRQGGQVDRADDDLLAGAGVGLGQDAMGFAQLRIEVAAASRASGKS